MINTRMVLQKTVAFPWLREGYGEDLSGLVRFLSSGEKGKSTFLY